MQPDKLKELRALVLRIPCGSLYSEKSKTDALALIDAELALHSTAEIAGTRAGLAELDREALRAQLAEVTRERDGLREAIEAARSHLDWPGARNNASADCALAVLREALKEPKS